ncbi:MAG: ATP-binding protein [Nibricoccus sp.]
MSAKSAKQFVHLRISRSIDTGMGIEAEAMPRIFEDAPSRPTTPPPDRSAGTGLGL